ncbi:extracellular solute-binding protein [Kribbella turkmenica]|uniref:Extracellular solute-binding protein n=1 Tax=Kribbella turkmenica TaxID=2530375 RepID=A0A4R4WWC7_9ACTN|nr:extracellular solute-binding protein [Kribbella turkmenica]TDD22054.1 extracellular solute-binding protein [Kribbella turkmenica]
MDEQTRISRRSLLWLTAVATTAAACGDAGDDAGPPEATVPAPSPTMSTPASKLSGDLRILLWSHFVPSHDKWFDQFAKNWGKEVGVNVTVDHINNTEIVARTAAEIQARQGHDLIQYIAPLSQFEPSVVDLKDVAEEAANRFGEQLELCVKSSQNPATGKHYAYSPGWVPDPGDYRKSLWESVGLPDGPTSWEDLLRGGAEIKKSKNIQMGLGMSQEIDSNMAGRALMWSYGASIQNEDEEVVINSPETVAAVEFMQRLFKDTMTNEVFSWNPASNNQGLIAGQMSYILNSISAWRTAQEANPEVADDIYFTPALKGPKTSLAAQHVMYNWIVPNHARNVDAAKEFLLHYTANWPSATYHSKLYDLPAFPRLVPQLNGWLDRDPFGAKPENKLGVLKNAIEWSTNIGHPGPANTAVGEVFATFVIPNMFAKAARGELSPEQAVADAERQIRPIFDKWRRRGLVGGV